MKKKILRIAISIIVAIGVLYLLQLLLTPKYMTGIIEGAFIAEYYENETEYEEKDHDVLFVGDCEVYENFVPQVLWEEYGIHSYIRGSAQQLIWQSYYLLEDSLCYEKPDVVVFNVLSMKYNEPQKEAYNRMSVDGMKWSTTKFNAITASMLEEESMLDYIFPILRYHSRWDELTTEDFQYMFYREFMAYNGYYMRVDVKPVTTIPDAPKLPDYEFGENAYFYLDKMRELCEENDIEFVLVKAPTLYPHWYSEWEEQIEEYATEHNLKYINYIEHYEDIGIDFQTDTYDAGLHLNLSGAKKLSTHFGKFLVDKCGLKSRHGEEELEYIWKVKTERFQKGIEEQKEIYNVE